MRFKALPALLCAFAGGAWLVAACSDTNVVVHNGVTTEAGAEEGGGPPEPTPGCGAADVKKGFVGSQSIDVGGSKRTYELYVPDAYDGKTSYPVVFVFHGDGGDGAGIRRSFDLEKESGGGAIFVYPDGQDTTWQFDDARGLAKDVGFIDAIAESVRKTLCTDKKRTFAVGFSRGAFFANMLGCLSKSNMRAVVAHGGGGPFGVDGSGTSFDDSGNLVCPAPPAAAMQVVGANDGLKSDAREARDYWRRVNGCKTSTSAFAPSPCLAYDGCAEGRPEIYCEIPSLGHAIWPQNGTKVTWAFLKTK